MPTGNLQPKGQWILTTDFLEENTTRYAKLIEEKYLVFLRKIIERLNNATPDNSSEVRSYILAYAQTLQRRYNLPTANVSWIKNHLAYVSTKNVDKHQIKHINEDIW